MTALRDTSPMLRERAKPHKAPLPQSSHVNMRTVEVFTPLASDIPALLDLTCKSAYATFGRNWDEEIQDGFRTYMGDIWTQAVSDSSSKAFAIRGLAVSRGIGSESAGDENEDVLACAYVTLEGERAYIGGLYAAEQKLGLGSHVVWELWRWLRTQPTLRTVEVEVLAVNTAVLGWAQRLGLVVVGAYEAKEVFPGSKVVTLSAAIENVDTPKRIPLSEEVTAPAEPAAPNLILSSHFDAELGSIPELRHSCDCLHGIYPTVPWSEVDLLLTELAANTIEHGLELEDAGNEHWLGIDIVEPELGDLRFEVYSPAPPFTPRVVISPLDATSGRGMFLLDSLSDRWGTNIRTDGNFAVWFECDYLPSSSTNASTREATCL